jgi:hypothetical protein
MITYFVRQFLEGDDCAGCGAAALWGGWRAQRLAMRGRLAVIRNFERSERFLERAVLPVGTAERARAPLVSPHLGLPRLRRGSRTTLEGRNAR